MRTVCWLLMLPMRLIKVLLMMEWLMLWLLVLLMLPVLEVGLVLQLWLKEPRLSVVGICARTNRWQVFGSSGVAWST